MPPTRTETTSSPQKGSKSKPQHHQSSTSESVPGVQKLKASLRQTRRLLAKDNLAANVRVETERRLKSLQADLGYAEAAKRERTVAVRYHKVKFFERQKVLRKINQIKRQLDTSAESPDTQDQLFNLRVDLNYILNYPKARKYISLFPPVVQHAESGALAPDGSKTGVTRKEVRDAIREQMERGELSAFPESQVLDNKPKQKLPMNRNPQSKTSSKQRKKQALPDVQNDSFFDSQDGLE